MEGVNHSHKTIESPWTRRKYVIRELDPTILAIFSRTDTPEVKNLRQKIQDKLDDIKREENRQKQLGENDSSKIDSMKVELQSYYEQVQKLMPMDEREYENRKKIVQYGLVQPKIKNEDDFLDLGKDASFLWASIVSLSEVPEDYAEVLQSLFRQGQSSLTKGGKDG
ncbi:MAG: hypothetical protein QXU32_06650 [Nitrososphaerales archaeon]